MSLKSNLQQLIKDRKGGVFTLKELEDYCHKYPAKLSQAERRLRPSESPCIERLMKHGAIIGYRYLEPGPDVTQWFKPPRTPKPLFNFNGELITKRVELNKQNDLRTNTKIPSLFR